MRITGNIGHLIRIENITKGNREFVFLYILEHDPPDAYKIVIKGIRSMKMPAILKKTARIRADSVTDFSRIEQDFPETAGHQIHVLPVISFYRTNQKAFKESLFLSGVRNVVEKHGSFFPSNRLTAVATGSDFFSRDDLLLKIWKQINKCQNIVITGPRRYGKTSLMRCIKDGAISMGYQPIMIDLESVYTPQEFVARLAIEAESRDMDEAEKNRQIEKLLEEQTDPWKLKCERLFRQIPENKYLCILDEVPYMLDSFLEKDKGESDESRERPEKEIDKFLEFFKAQRKEYGNKCRFVFSGSIHLKAYLEDNNLDADSFSDCREIRLDFFDPETTRDYIEGLLLGQEIVLKDEIIQEIVDLTTPGIPYFIQIVLLQVVSLYRKNPSFSREDLYAIYKKEIVGQDSRRFFDTFERHFKRYGRRKAGAKAILDELSDAREEGKKRKDLERIFSISSYHAEKLDFDTLLQYLEHDFYIEKIKGTDRYRFSSPILRDYWFKNQKTISID